MKAIKKVSAGLLLTIGFIFLMVPVAVVTRKESTPQDRIDALGSFVLGLPAAAWGGWLAWQLYRQGQQEVRDRLHSSFYRLIQQGNGQISLLRFAMETQLPTATAKHYLDEKAKEFDATFDVSEEGGIFYHFIL